MPAPAALDIIARSPGALHLRYLQTLVDISSDKGTNVVFPLPLDIIRPFLESRQK